MGWGKAVPGGSVGRRGVGGGGKPRTYKGMERGRRVRMQGGGGEKVARRFGGRGGRERIDEFGDLGLVGIAEDPGDAGERGQFSGSALGITAGDDNAEGGGSGVRLVNGSTGLGVGRGSYRAGE